MPSRARPTRRSSAPALAALVAAGLAFTLATPARAQSAPAGDTGNSAPLQPPPPKQHDLGIELGLNNPAGLGGRYLFLLPGTVWAVGAAAGASTWGFKWAVVLRRAEDFGSGQFFQASLGLSTGLRGVQRDVTTTDGVKRAVFDYTPGRTLDVAYGYRMPMGPIALDVFVGLSINLRGTVLQVQGPDGLVTIDDATRTDLLLFAPGGLILGASASLPL